MPATKVWEDELYTDDVGIEQVTHDSNNIYIATGETRIMSLSKSDGSKNWESDVHTNDGSAASRGLEVLSDGNLVSAGSASDPLTFIIDSSTGDVIDTHSPLSTDEEDFNSFFNWLATGPSGEYYIHANTIFTESERTIRVDSDTGSVEFEDSSIEGREKFVDFLEYAGGSLWRASDGTTSDSNNILQEIDVDTGNVKQELTLLDTSISTVEYHDGVLYVTTDDLLALDPDDITNELWSVPIENTANNTLTKTPQGMVSLDTGISVVNISTQVVYENIESIDWWVGSLSHTVDGDNFWGGDYTGILQKGKFTAEPPAASYSVLDLSVSTSTGSATVSFQVGNTGEVDGNPTITVGSQDGSFEKTYNPSIQGGDIFSETANFSGISGGTYTVVVDVQGQDGQTASDQKSGVEISGSPDPASLTVTNFQANYNSP